MKKLNEMSLEEIKELDRQTLTEEQFAELDENELVIGSENNGRSGHNPRLELFTYNLADGSTLDLYFKPRQD